MRKLIPVVAATASVLAVAAFLVAPSSYRLEASTVAPASSTVVREELADLQRWGAWAPGTSIDPRAERSYGGRPGSPGATSYWSGASGCGAGRMSVVSVGADHVDVEVEVERPHRSSSDLEFRIAPEGEGTRVTATLSGENDAFDRVRWFLVGRRLALSRSLDDRLERLRSATARRAPPRVSRVEVSSVFSAPPGEVRARIVDLRSWQAFAPWAGPGFAAARFGGPGSGVGSSAYWSEPGTGDEGRMTIVSDRPEGVDVEVEMKGRDSRLASNDVEFRLAPAGRGTRVTWTVSGDGGVGPSDLDRGLARLKALAEGSFR